MPDVPEGVVKNAARVNLFFDTLNFGAASEKRFDFYAAINEEHFYVPTGRAFHVLRHHEPRLS
jgi:hypothetical protein